MHNFNACFSTSAHFAQNFEFLTFCRLFFSISLSKNIKLSFIWLFILFLLFYEKAKTTQRMYSFFRDSSCHFLRFVIYLSHDSVGYPRLPSQGDCIRYEKLPIRHHNRESRKIIEKRPSVGLRRRDLHRTRLLSKRRSGRCSEPKRKISRNRFYQRQF